MSQGAYFTENQKFNQWWIILFLGVYTAAVWAIAFAQLIMKIPVGNDPTSNTAMLIIWLVAGVLMPGLFLAMNMHTEITNDGLNVKFFPFHLKPRHFSVQQIESAEAVVYSPIREYGGWGIRYGKNGLAYNVRGNEGVLLKLKDNKNVLIGTQKKDELFTALNKIMKKGP